MFKRYLQFVFPVLFGVFAFAITGGLTNRPCDDMEFSNSENLAALSARMKSRLEDQSWVLQKASRTHPFQWLLEDELIRERAKPLGYVKEKLRAELVDWDLQDNSSMLVLMANKTDLAELGDDPKMFSGGVGCLFVESRIPIVRQICQPGGKTKAFFLFQAGATHKEKPELRSLVIGEHFELKSDPKGVFFWHKQSEFVEFTKSAKKADAAH